MYIYLYVYIYTYTYIYVYIYIYIYVYNAIWKTLQGLFSRPTERFTLPAFPNSTEAEFREPSLLKRPLHLISSLNPGSRSILFVNKAYINFEETIKL